MECFQDSCISACMTSRELCGRWMEIWPARSASSLDFPLVFAPAIASDVADASDVVGSGASCGTILRTRNSRATPKEIDPMTARGPR